MKGCEKCGQSNADDARFCAQCGTHLEVPPEATAAAREEPALWRALIGPQPALLFSWTSGWSWGPPVDDYLARFKTFASRPAPGFALTWHWPTFLLDPFLWFLYRKMYLYAVVYAVGPVVSAYVTGDFTVGVVWRVIAGATANYVFYWHIKEHAAELLKRPQLSDAALATEIRDRGGVQPYVIWLAVLLHVLMVFVVVQLSREGAGGRAPAKPKASLISRYSPRGLDTCHFIQASNQSKSC